MKMTRRGLLYAGAGIAALSILPRSASATAGAQTVSIVSPRMRWEDFVQDPTRLASLKRGIAVMKSRRPSDPTSWFFQSAIHAVTPAFVAAALQVDPDIAAVDQARFWNQCPHSAAHYSADFLIWHRAYVYYFERILRDAAQDPTLSLPYWNYTEPAQRRFPPEFAQEETVPTTQLPGNPLFDHRREQAFMFGLYTLSEDVVTTANLFDEVNFFGATEDTGFAGGVVDDEGGRGLIERRPHDLIHFAVGGAIGTGDITMPGGLAGLMASVPTAAFDPIFWVHHANIDRLWTVWECLDTPRRQWGHVPPREWLDATPWSFHDFDGSIKNETRLHYLDRRNLAVSYDTDDPVCTPLSATDPLAAAPAGGDEQPFTVPANIRSFVLAAEAGQLEQKVRLSPYVARTVTIPLESMPALENQDARSAVLTAPEEVSRRLILELRDVVVEGVTSVGFDVYATLSQAPAARPDRSSPMYLGMLALFGALPGDMNGHMHGGGVQRFDITRLTVLEGFDPAQLRVRIVPFDLLTPAEGQRRLLRPVGITVGNIRVLVVEGVPAP